MKGRVTCAASRSTATRPPPEDSRTESGVKIGGATDNEAGIEPVCPLAAPGKMKPVKLSGLICWARSSAKFAVKRDRPVRHFDVGTDSTDVVEADLDLPTGIGRRSV